MTKKITVVYNALQVATFKDRYRRALCSKEMSDITIYDSASVVIENHTILYVGATSEIKDRYINNSQYKAEIIDATGKTVVPGFVDAHVHLVFAGSREKELEWKLQGLSYQEIAEKGGGIYYTVGLTRKATREELKVQGLARLKNMLSHGTTSAEAKSGYGLDTETEILSLEIINELSKEQPVELVPTYLGAHAFPEEYKSPAQHRNYIDIIVQKVLPLVAKKHLARYCDIFCEDGYFSVEESREVLLKAKELGLSLKIHADEMKDTGGALLAAELKATSAEHLLCINENGIAAMKNAGVIAVLLPGTPFSLNTGYAPARKMIDSGLAVALGTDLNPNCYTESMPLMMSFACYGMRMTPAEALAASTINAAYSCGLGETTGTIEPGKQADLVIIDAPSYLFIPYRFGANLCNTVIKKGKVVWKAFQ